MEALCHQILRSAGEGYNFFTRYCEAYEANGRLTVCTSLLNATRDYLEHLPPGSAQEPWLKWLRYWEARLARRLRRNTAPEALRAAGIPEEVLEQAAHPLTGEPDGINWNIWFYASPPTSERTVSVSSTARGCSINSNDWKRLFQRWSKPFKSKSLLSK